jgi:putative membrane protein
VPFITDGDMLSSRYYSTLGEHMLELTLRYFHFTAIFVLVSMLVAEHLLLKPELKREELSRLARIDLIYGVSAVVVFVAGLSLWLWVGKPAEFYSSNPVFHTKLTLFVVMALVSIYPTQFFLKNRRTEHDVIAVPKSIIHVVRLELLLFVLIPALAVAMARGVGYS